MKAPKFKIGERVVETITNNEYKITRVAKYDEQYGYVYDCFDSEKLMSFACYEQQLIRKVVLTIEEAIKEKFGYTFEDLQIKCRKQIYSEPRAIASYLLKVDADLKYHEIGEILKRDHSDIVYLVGTMRGLYIHDYHYTRLINDLEERINESRID